MSLLEKAKTLRGAADEKIRSIQANKDLTREGKARQIAETRERANKEIVQLRESHQKEQAAQRDRLHRQVFGLSYKATVSESEKTLMQQNYRDALFRADTIQTPDAALRMLGRAQMVGDSLLMKAVAAVAYEQGWNSVLREYAATSEATAENLQELQEFEHKFNAPGRNLSESMAFSKLPESAEERDARIAAVAG